MSDSEFDYDDNAQQNNQSEQRQRARFDVYNHYHDVVDGSKLSHFAVQNDVFCMVSSGGVASSGELYIRDSQAESLKRMPLPCAVSGLFQSMSGQQVFVTSNAGDLYYVNVATMSKPMRVVSGGSGAPVILDVAVLDPSTLPRNPQSQSDSHVKCLLALKNGAVGFISFLGGGDDSSHHHHPKSGGGAGGLYPAAAGEKNTGVVTHCPALGKNGLPVTAIEAISHEAGVVVLATTPTGLYAFHGPDAISATQQPPKEVCRVNSNLTTFDPAVQGRPLHVVRSFPGTIPTAFVWTTASAVVHGSFNKERTGRISFSQVINFPFTKDIRVRGGGGGSGAGGGAAYSQQAGTSTSGGERAPLQVMTTAFHMFLRYESRIVVLRVPPGLPWRPRVDPAAAEARRMMERTGKLSETFAEFDWNDRHVFDFGRKNIKIIGIARDVENRRLYAFSDQYVWNLCVANERVEIWRLFFERATDKDEKWENRVRYYFAAANLAPKHSRDRDQVYFHLGRAAYNMSKPSTSRLLLPDSTIKGAAAGPAAAASSASLAAAKVGGGETLSWNSANDLEDLAVDAFSRCSMFDEIVLLIRGSSTLLPKFIEKRLEVLTESGTAGPQQLALLITFALLLRLEPKMDRAAAANHNAAPRASAEDLTSASQLQQQDPTARALDKLVNDLKSKPKLIQLLNDNYFYSVVTRLLESLGHLNKSVDLAIATNRFRQAVSHHCQMRAYDQAAAVLVDHCTAKQDFVDLWYDFAGQIVTRCRDDVFRGFRKIAKVKSNQVDFRRFIPAFIAYDESRKTDPDVHEHKVVSLLSLIMMQNKGSVTAGNGLPTVLNDLFLSILFLMLAQARREQEERRLRKDAADPAGQADSDEDMDMTEIIDGQIDEVLGTDLDEVAIDQLPDISLEYALRKCVELGHIELSIRLYRLLKMPEQALTASLRLPNGLERAQSLLEELANDPQHNERFMKNLWMLLAQLVLSDTTRMRDSTTDTKIVLGLIARSQGILKLEEVIVLLEAQEALQDFRTAVCDSLNSYTEKIKALTDQMSSATKLAENLRSDLANLDHQFGYVTAAQRCTHCKGALLKSKHDPFVIFPTCRHAVHYNCGRQMFTQCDESVLLAVARASDIDVKARGAATPNLWQKCLEAECPYCGEYAIQRITAPLSGDVM